MTECPRTITDDEAIRLMARTAMVYAKRLSRHDRSLTDDLIQEGLMGAMEAARTFDPRVGVKFETFAWRRVRGRMKDHLRELDFLPRCERQRAAKEGSEVGRVVSVEAVGWTGGRWGDDCMTAFDRGKLRFDPPHHDPEPSDGAEAEFAAWVRREYPGRASPDQIRVLAAYYVRGKRLTEIGLELGVGQSRASQLLTGAMSAIKGSRCVTGKRGDYGPRANRVRVRERAVSVGRLAGFGLRVVRFEKRAGGGVHVVECKCGGEREVGYELLNYWAKIGRVPDCRGVCPKPTHEADPCQTPTPTTAPTRTRSESASP